MLEPLLCFINISGSLILVDLALSSVILSSNSAISVCIARRTKKKQRRSLKSQFPNPNRVLEKFGVLH